MASLKGLSGKQKKFCQIHYVYKTINKLNDIEYIGIHSTYHINDNYLGSGTLLKKEIKRFGKKYFKKTIIEQFDSREKALQKEKELVCPEYLENKKVYNIIPGGRGNPNIDNWIIPELYISPCFNQDIEHLMEFYIDTDKIEEFKKSIEVDINGDSWNLIIFRKQAKNMFLNTIDSICDVMNKEWNDKRFHSIAEKQLILLFRMGFNEIIKVRRLKAA